MFKFDDLFKKVTARAGSDAERPDWPLWFDDYSFGARCYNTLRCSTVFARKEHSLRLDRPSGQPHAPDWKDDWYASFGSGGDFKRYGFPSPVDIRWTALDGIEREVVLDLDAVFPERLILHKVPREEVREGWESSPHLRQIEILLEVNDRTLNVYMRAWVLTRQPRDPANPKNNSHRDLMLAWTHTYAEGADHAG